MLLHNYVLVQVHLTRVQPSGLLSLPPSAREAVPLLLCLCPPMFRPDVKKYLGRAAGTCQNVRSVLLPLLFSREGGGGVCLRCASAFQMEYIKRTSSPAILASFFCSSQQQNPHHSFTRWHLSFHFLSLLQRVRNTLFHSFHQRTSFSTQAVSPSKQLSYHPNPNPKKHSTLL